MTNKILKNFISFLLVIIFAFPLFSCGGSTYAISETEKTLTLFDEYNFQRMDEDDEVYMLLCCFDDVDFDRYFSY